MEHTQEKSIDLQIFQEVTKQLKIKHDTLKLQLKIKHDTLKLLIIATVVVIIVVVALCYGYDVGFSTEMIKMHLQKQDNKRSLIY